MLQFRFALLGMMRRSVSQHSRMSKAQRCSALDGGGLQSGGMPARSHNAARESTGKLHRVCDPVDQRLLSTTFDRQ